MTQCQCINHRGIGSHSAFLIQRDLFLVDCLCAFDYVFLHFVKFLLSIFMVVIIFNEY